MTASQKDRVIIVQEDLDCLLLTVARLLAENRRLKVRRGPTKKALAAALREGRL